MRDNDNKNQTDAGAGLFERWRQATDSVPGARFLRGQAQAAEDLALRHLQNRLDQINEYTPASGGDKPQATTPAARMQNLLDRSLSQKPETAEQDFYLHLLGQLVPDEARILAALSDGGLIAVCHVDATSRLGTHSERLLSYASRVGVEAGVMLTDNVATYLGHLAALGLLDIGPEDKTRAAQYEMLETNSEVRKLCARIEKEMNMKPRLARHTARLSGLGMRLWQACQSSA